MYVFMYLYECMYVCAVDRVIVTNNSSSSSSNKTMVIDSDLFKTNIARTRKPWGLSKYDAAVYDGQHLNVKPQGVSYLLRWPGCSF